MHPSFTIYLPLALRRPCMIMFIYIYNGSFTLFIYLFLSFFLSFFLLLLLLCLDSLLFFFFFLIFFFFFLQVCCCRCFLLFFVFVVVVFCCCWCCCLFCFVFLCPDITLCFYFLRHPLQGLSVVTNHSPWYNCKDYLLANQHLLACLLTCLLACLTLPHFTPFPSLSSSSSFFFFYFFFFLFFFFHSPEVLDSIDATLKSKK